MEVGGVKLIACGQEVRWIPEPVWTRSLLGIESRSPVSLVNTQTEITWFLFKTSNFIKLQHIIIYLTLPTNSSEYHGASKAVEEHMDICTQKRFGKIYYRVELKGRKNIVQDMCLTINRCPIWRYDTICASVLCLN
jgi:hypothetical protein